MHVLMVSFDYPPTVGGISAHVYELCSAIRRLGHEVTVATRNMDNSQPAREMIDGIDIFRFTLKGFGWIYGMQVNAFLKKLCHEIRPDILHIHGMRPLEFFNVKGIPMVYTNHTSGYLKRIRKGGYRIPMLKKLFRKPALILAPSEELLDFPFDVPGIKQFISNGVIADRFDHDKAFRLEKRKELGLADADVVGIVTRRMVWKNGVTYLAEATEHIRDSRVRLVFIGDGEKRDEIAEKLEKHFSGRYFLLGEKTHEEIVSYYSIADFSILPSLMEATSISGLEAMAASLPLVGTRVGGIPVLLKDGENGLLCEPENPVDLAEKIDQLLSMDFRDMGMKSRQLVEDHFDWMCIAEQTVEAYRKVL